MPANTNDKTISVAPLLRCLALVYELDHKYSLALQTLIEVKDTKVFDLIRYSFFAMLPYPINLFVSLFYIV